MIFAVSMTFIDQTIVSIAAPEVQKELGLTSTGVQWAINAYLLSLATLFAFGGRRGGDRRGGVRRADAQVVRDGAPRGSPRRLSSGWASGARRSCTRRTTLAPSATAVAQRLIDPALTSPAA